MNRHDLGLKRNVMRKLQNYLGGYLALFLAVIAGYAADPLENTTSRHTVAEVEARVHRGMPLAELLDYVKSTPIMVQGRTHCILADGDLWIVEEQDSNKVVRVRDFKLERQAGDNEDSSNWVQQYYRHPSPERVEAEMRKLQKAGVLSKESTFYPLGAFFARVFATNESRVERWMAVVDGFPQDERKPFMVALKWANTPATDKLLLKYSLGKGPLAGYCADVRASTPPDFKALAHPVPDDLDGCWASFFATGDRDYVLTVIRCATAPETKGNVDMGREAARWSLKSLCGMDPAIAKIKDDFYKSASGQQQKSLDELFADRPTAGKL